MEQSRALGVRLLGAPLSCSRKFVSVFVTDKAREVGEAVGKLQRFAYSIIATNLTMIISTGLLDVRTTEGKTRRALDDRHAGISHRATQVLWCSVIPTSIRNCYLPIEFIFLPN
jgi:hypothetical protein